MGIIDITLGWFLIVCLIVFILIIFDMFLYFIFYTSIREILASLFRIIKRLLKRFINFIKKKTTYRIKIRKIIKEIKSNPYFNNCFDDVEKEVRGWSVYQIDNWSKDK